MNDWPATQMTVPADYNSIVVNERSEKGEEERRRGETREERAQPRDRRGENE